MFSSVKFLYTQTRKYQKNAMTKLFRVHLNVTLFVTFLGALHVFFKSSWFWTVKWINGFYHLKPNLALYNDFLLPNKNFLGLWHPSGLKQNWRHPNMPEVPCAVKHWQKTYNLISDGTLAPPCGTVRAVAPRLGISNVIFWTALYL